MKKQKVALILFLSFTAIFTASAAFANLNFGTNSITTNDGLILDNTGSNTSPLTIKTNGSAGNYTPTNSGIFIKDAAGTELLRIFASDPDTDNNYNGGNLYIGDHAGFSQPTDNIDAGWFNLGIGTRALYSISTGFRNSAFGFESLYSNNTGMANTALGYQTLHENLGINNTASGAYALRSNVSGNSNTAIGYSALYSNLAGSGNVALGHNAGLYEMGSNSLYIDNQDRTNTAGDKAGALLYGTFDAVPANQTLKINATTTLPKLIVTSAQNKGTVALSGGTANVTVASGSVCVVSETTDSTKTVKGAVSGTTLTITGTGTDVIAYICL